MKKMIMSAVTFLYMASGIFAGGFDLPSVFLSDLKDPGGAAASVPVPARPLASLSRSPVMGPALDMSVKIPFFALNKRMAALKGCVKVLDRDKPVFYSHGDHIIFSNVTIDYHGVDLEPTVQLLPAFEGENRLAIRFSNAETIASFAAKGLGGIDKNGLITSIVDGLTGSLTGSMDEAFAANKVQLKAKDVLSFTYNSASWTLYAAVTPGFVAPLLPGLINDVALTAFSFDDQGFILGVRSGSGAAISRAPGSNLAISDGLLTNFLRKSCESGDYDLSPSGREGGIKFRADGRVEVALKVHMGSLPLKPDVYAVIEFAPILTAPNTIAIRFEKVTVDKAYGVDIPGFINKMLQDRVIAGIVSGIMTNKELAQAVSARKLDDKTVELKLKNSAFLPSFSDGAAVRSMKIERGFMYLGFEF